MLLPPSAVVVAELRGRTFRDDFNAVSRRRIWELGGMYVAL
jgi:hypothetical protein